MNIIGLHLQHDAAAAVVCDGHLRYYHDLQKDNHLRHAALRPEAVPALLEALPVVPDVISVGGWFGHGAGYGDANAMVCGPPVRGHDATVEWISTSHLRAHAFSAYGLSPYEQGRPCYVLIWEGDIGAFLFIDERCSLRLLCEPLARPGQRYAFAFELAHSGFGDGARGYSYDSAGKLMALAGVLPSPTVDNQGEIDRLLGAFSSESQCKGDWRESRYWNAGPTDPGFRQFARQLSDALFAGFHETVRGHIGERAPLLIAGGCGLNCGWNTRWRESGLFEDVFIPPCPDDSGVALGAALDAQRHFTGQAKLTWRVDAGAEFCEDVAVPERFRRYPLDYQLLARLLRNGCVIAWVEGRYEIGPRALGWRSLLAAPFPATMKDRLNRIKEREPYRPVAPVCREEDVSRYFDWHGPSPYMLHFQRVIADRIDAVVHDDGSARVQTVTAESSPHLHRLLTECVRTGQPGVLCNTSLNFPGHGFINRMSDLIRFVSAREVEAFVVNGSLYVARPDEQRLPDLVRRVSPSAA